eukprot:scaffold31_cov263-Pinguiococcus_pyrenoidosus.AAC.8
MLDAGGTASQMTARRGGIPYLSTPPLGCTPGTWCSPVAWRRQARCPRRQTRSWDTSPRAPPSYPWAALAQRP